MLRKNWGIGLGVAPPVFSKVTHWPYTTVMQVWWPRPNLSTAQKDLETAAVCFCDNYQSYENYTHRQPILAPPPSPHRVGGDIPGCFQVPIIRHSEYAHKRRRGQTATMIKVPCDKALKQHRFQMHYKIILEEEWYDYSGPKELRVYAVRSKTDRIKPQHSNTAMDK